MKMHNVSLLLQSNRFIYTYSNAHMCFCYCRGTVGELSDIGICMHVACRGFQSDACACTLPVFP